MTLEVRDLRVELASPSGRFAALDGVSLRVEAGECVALVGESGCGKTTFALACMRLLPPGGRIAGGSIRLDGRELLSLSEREMDSVRGAQLGLIFQEPSAALDPVMRVGAQVAEPLEIHGLARGEEARRRVVETLRAVGLRDPERLLPEVPHRLSGGMRQRVGIAAAIAAGPRVLFADEPTTALDAPLRASVLDLLDRRRREDGSSVVLISHDLVSVGRRADRIAVLYAGRVVEEGPASDVLGSPIHPYTRALLACCGRDANPIPGSPPPGPARPSGCRFHPRCSLRVETCVTRDPRLLPVASRADRRVACPVVSP
jgi:oligopeptide/dipeptide ABC transporter ATP-binding protein